MWLAARAPLPYERWTVLESTEVEASRWLTLQRQRIGLPSGDELERYYRVELSDVIVVFALTEADGLLLVEQYRHGIGLVVAELPAGMVDPTDATPLEAAQRELCEETGYMAGSMEHLGTVAMSAPRQSNLLHCFLARDCRRVGEPSGDVAEQITVRREPRSRLAELVREGVLASQTSLACAYLAALRLGTET